MSTSEAVMPASQSGSRPKLLTDEEAAQQLIELNKKSKDIDHRRIKVNATLEQKQKEFDSLKAEAEKLFGTSKIDELKAKIMNIRATNTKAITEFSEALTHHDRETSEMEVLLMD